MIENSLIRKLIIAFLSLVIIIMMYFFPINKENNFPSSLKYIDDSKMATIYLIDQHNYLAMTNIKCNEIDSLKKAKELIEYLTIKSNKSNYIPNGFTPIIPKGTKINDISLKDGLLKIDFSKELLNSENLDKTIESIIYSLTTISDIKEILFYVDGGHLNKINNILYPNPLNRDFGINKIYNINSYKEIEKTTVYYLSKYENQYYYIPVTKFSNDNRAKIEIIIEELKTNKVINTNLMSYLVSSTELLNYEILEEQINLSFNKYLLDNFDEKSILEEVKYTIGLSIKENYNVHTINFLVDDKIISTLDLKTLE